MTNQKKLLMIALDFPPCQSAGVQRTLKFFEHLPELGWQTTLLTSVPSIYNLVDNQLTIDPNREKDVYRAFGLNSVKHLSFKGKHLDCTIKPDRFFSWYWPAVYKAKQLVKKQQPDILWSTFPVPTTHKIACTLKRKYDLPWVADFRDPFAGNNPLIQIDNKPAKRIDADVVGLADRLVFTTERAAHLYLASYPNLNQNKICIIENGYNETTFDAFGEPTQVPPIADLDSQTTIKLLHSGGVYEGGRDPRALFEALALFLDRNPSYRPKLKLVFRGLYQAGPYKDLIDQKRLADNVEFLPSIPYQDSIQEMLNAQALVILQGEVFNNQVPGKTYEYLRACKPILALTKHDSATAKVIETTEHALVADIDKAPEIANKLEELVQTCTKNIDYQQFGRFARSKQLANLLNSTISEKIESRTYRQ